MYLDGIVLKRSWGGEIKNASGLVAEKINETLAYYNYPQTHWVRIRTNNPLGRMMREIRRRTRVVGAFPDGHSALMLVAARLRRIAGTKWGTRRYLCMDTLNKIELNSQATAKQNVRKNMDTTDLIEPAEMES